MTGLGVVGPKVSGAGVVPRTAGVYGAYPPVVGLGVVGPGVVGPGVVTRLVLLELDESLELLLLESLLEMELELLEVAVAHAPQVACVDTTSPTSCVGERGVVPLKT